MLEYVNFKGEQTAIVFGNAAFYRYEKKHKESGFKAFMNAVPQNELGEYDTNNVKIAFFVDITFAAFVAAGSITNKPFTSSEDDVAMWLDTENLIKVLEMITDSLPRDKGDKADNTDSEQGEA